MDLKTLNTEKPRVEVWVPGAEWWGNRELWVQDHRLSYRVVSSRDLKDSMVTVVKYVFSL